MRILIFLLSRIQGSKRHRIPDPDPQHCEKVHNSIGVPFVIQRIQYFRNWIFHTKMVQINNIKYWLDTNLYGVVKLTRSKIKYSIRINKVKWGMEGTPSEWLWPAKYLRYRYPGRRYRFQLQYQYHGTGTSTVPSNRVTSSSCYNFVRVLQNFWTGLLPLFVKILHF